ncbi:7350_t:CDS:2 [Funneliformis mosseae]|uniref:7350_t:CDS:1 n=1 Tax=Funneliformis mosseae TaxID=27381 RepID=A0A9N8YU99_FUNMO|nr:7350_t:CDS:2 [Funneliformis mosseae]
MVTENNRIQGPLSTLEFEQEFLLIAFINLCACAIKCGSFQVLAATDIPMEKQINNFEKNIY